VAAVERQRWQRRRPVYTAVVVQEEVDVDGGGGDDGVESGGDLESFGMKSETTQGRLLFIVSKY
jgi:hypothetical protein